MLSYDHAKLMMQYKSLLIIFAEQVSSLTFYVNLDGDFIFQNYVCNLKNRSCMFLPLPGSLCPDRIWIKYIESHPLRAGWKIQKNSFGGGADSGGFFVRFSYNSMGQLTDMVDRWDLVWTESGCQMLMKYMVCPGLQRVADSCGIVRKESSSAFLSRLYPRPACCPMLMPR